MPSLWGRPAASFAPVSRLAKSSAVGSIAFIWSFVILGRLVLTRGWPALPILRCLRAETLENHAGIYPRDEVRPCFIAS